MILRFAISEEPTWNNITPSEIIRRSIKSWDTIWNYKTLFYLTGCNMKSYCSIWIHETQDYLARHTVRVTIWYQLFLELENVRQFNERWGKKLDVNLLHRQRLICSHYFAIWNNKALHYFKERNIKSYCLILEHIKMALITYRKKKLFKAFKKFW